MNSQPKIPDAETRAKSVARLQEVCHQFDALNLLLDRTIAQAELDIRRNPLMTKHLDIAEPPTKNFLKENAS
jgi:hypothetical protein